MRTTTAYRLFDLAVPFDGTAGHFVGFDPFDRSLPVPATAHAVCPVREHTAPAPDCGCGFSGQPSIGALIDAAEPSVAGLSGAVIAHLELGLPLLFDHSGLRAGWQRVLTARLLPWCRQCIAADTEPDRVDAYACAVTDEDQPHPIVVCCPAHATGRYGLLPVTVHHLSDLLRTNVDWLDPATAERIRVAIEQRDTRGQQRGPLAADRPVRALRMGQRGFVAPDALRTDAAGRLRLDPDATAPQRRTPTHRLAVLRTVSLTYELHLTPDDADTAARALDTADADDTTTDHWLAVKLRGRRHLDASTLALAV